MTLTKTTVTRVALFGVIFMSLGYYCIIRYVQPSSIMVQIWQHADSKCDTETRGTDGVTGQVHRLRKIRVYDASKELSAGRNSTCRFNSSATTDTGRRCDRWIVVTTIYIPGKSLHKISELQGWCMVVVADKNGPVSMDIPNIEYLTVVRQESCGYQICQLVPWNHFGRKNIGYMYAIEHGARVIYDTDDDNEPIDGAPQEIDNIDYARYIKIQGTLWNPYPEFGPDKDIWPRGFPLNHILDTATKTVEMGDMTEGVRVGVVQYLAQHDPDVDAIYRLTRKLPYEFNTKQRRLVIPRNVMSPYNAQATLHSRDAFWGMLLPITVHGRVSDIWRSYFTQRLLWDIGKYVAFDSPEVIQYRNAHNSLADLDAEMDLYYKADNLVKFLLVWTPAYSAKSLEQRLVQLGIDLYEFGFVGKVDVALMEAWIKDLRCLGYDFPDPLGEGGGGRGMS